MSKYNVGLKTHLLEGLSEPDFFGTWCINSENKMVKMIFLYHFKKITIRYKTIDNNIDVLRQTACVVVNPTKVNSFAYLFNCTTVGRVSN